MSVSQQKENWFVCVVCGGRTRFFHLGTKICRACASYYRRAVTEQLTYVCKFDGKCQIDKVKCRACRFEKCKAAGARLIANEPGQTVTEQPSSSITSAFTVCKSRPKLDELAKGYDLFLLAQRSLFTMKHPELGMAEEKFIRPKKKYLSKMEVDSIPLVLRFINDHFGPFKNLGKQQKIDLAIDVFDDFSFFNKAYMTCKFFPNIEDDRIVHTEGYYTATTQIDPEWFFEGYVVVDRIHEYIQIIEPIRIKILRSINKARQLKARKIDYLAFMLLALWKHIEYANLLTDEMTTYKEELLKEWMDSLRDDYGEDAVKRFAQLMIFYYESDDLVLELVKSKTVLRVYLLRRDEDDWCDIQAHMKKLNLADDNEVKAPQAP